MTKSIFNKGAFQIKVKAHDPIKYLDGAFRLAVRVDHFESGEPVETNFEVYRDAIGHYHIDQG